MATGLSLDVDAFAGDGCGEVSSVEVDEQNIEYATIYTKYQDMFRKLMREEFRYNLDRPDRDYDDVEVGDEVSENSVKDQTYLGMFRTERKYFTFVSEESM